MIAVVDWPLVLLVSCLFAITNHDGIAGLLLEFLTSHGLLSDSLAELTPFGVAKINAIGCVPAAMLLQLRQTPSPGGALP